LAKEEQGRAMKIIKALKRGRFSIVLFSLLLTSKIFAGELIVSWNPNSEDDLKGYKIHYGNSSGNYDNTIDVGKVTIYTVSNINEGINYYFVLTAYDEAGNESEYSDEVFAFIEKNDDISPQISNLIIVDATHINLAFNEPVEKSSSENVSNYQINGGISVVKAELIGDNNKVQLTTTVHEEMEYTIIINNVKDRAAMPNVIAPNSSYQYEYIDLTSPSIISVTIDGEEKVKVVFSEPVEEESAEKISNYNINNEVKIAQAVLETNTNTVHLTTSPHCEGNYTITVTNIKDRAANPNTIVENNAFNYEYIDKILPVVENVLAKDENYLEVLFSEPVEKLSAENKSNYSISDGIIITNSILDESFKIVKLTTSAHVTASYTITFNNIKDRAKSPNTIANNSSFQYSYNDKIPPQIVSVLALAKDSIEIIFTEPIAKQAAENISNYNINKGIIINKAILDEKAKTVFLTTSVHSDGNYIITVRNIIDRAFPPNKIIENSNVEYQYIDTTAPAIVSVEALFQDQVNVVFDEPVEKSTAENLSNYQINNGIVVTSAILDINGNIVHLLTSIHQSGNYIIVLNNIKDRAQNPNIINPNSYFNYLYVDTSPPNMTNVETLDETHLKVTFSEKVEQPSAESVANYKIEPVNGSGGDNIEQGNIKIKATGLMLKNENLNDKLEGAKVEVLSLSLNSNERIVDIYTTAHKPGKYVLVANKIKDKAVNPNSIIGEDRFKYDFLDKISPLVSDIIIVDKTHVDVVFSESLNAESAESIENFRIDNGIDVLNAKQDLSLNIVHLTTSAHESGRSYNLTLNNIYDLAATPNIIAPNSSIQYMFIDQNPNFPQPIVLDWINVSADGFLALNWSKGTDGNVLGYKVYYGTESRNYDTNLDVGNVLTYSISGLIEGKSYYFAVTAYNVHGLESEFSNEQSAVVQVIDLEPPTIYTVNAKSDTELVVTYTENVKKLSAEDINNYKINNGIQIYSAKLDTNQRSVQLITSVHQPGEYEIIINNVNDLAPSPNVIEKDSRFSYQFNPNDDLAPFVTELKIIDRNHVDVLFSENLNKSSSEKIENYNINNNITIFQTTLDQNKRLVHLVTSDHFSGIRYTLTINNVKDCAFPPNCIAPDTKVSYNYVENDDLPLEIYTVQAKSDSLLEVHFTKKIQQQQAKEINNYYISNEIQVLQANLIDNDRTAQLVTSPHQKGVTYVLAVSNIYDLAQPPNIIKEHNSYRYAYLPDDFVPPVILSAEAKDETCVDVVFSEMLDRYSAEQEYNYSINKNVSIIDVKFDNELNMVHLVITKLTGGENYTLTINNIKDIALEPNVILQNSTIDFSYILMDKAPPIVENCYLGNKTNLFIVFNEIIERESAEDLLNYKINNGIEIVDAFLDSSLKSVCLTTSEHHNNITYTLTVNNIRDRATAPNTIAQNSKIQYSLNVTSNFIVTDLNRSNYQLANLKVGDTYYVDRDFILTKVPLELSNSCWIKTANNDVSNKENNFLHFTLSLKSIIYVGFDSRALNYPEWLLTNFHRIGKTIEVTADVQKFDVWAMESEPGLITFGGNNAQGAENVNSMYVVLVKGENQNNLMMPDGMNDPESVKSVTDYILDQNYPNPFNEGTKIRFHLLEDANVEIKIFNILGQTVNTLVNEQLTAGHHLIPWASRNNEGYRVPSGMYFVRMVVKRKEKVDSMVLDRVVYTKVRKMLLIK